MGLIEQLARTLTETQAAPLMVIPLEVPIMKATTLALMEPQMEERLRALIEHPAKIQMEAQAAVPTAVPMDILMEVRVEALIQTRAEEQMMVT